MPPVSRRIAVPAALLALAVLACASSDVRLAPITAEPTGELLPGKFVWRDLVTDDMAASKRFYGELFGWTFEGDGEYVTIQNDGTAIGGMVFLDRTRLNESAWVGNLSVEDVDRAAHVVHSEGGSVSRPPFDAPDRGRIALVDDPDGATLLLVRASGGDPPDTDPVLRSWFWSELWTHDVEGAKAFYGELVGYRAEQVDLDGGGYDVFVRDGVRRAGIMQAPPEVDAQWLPYVLVADTSTLVDRAEALGARVYHEQANLAILIDPVGAPFAVYMREGSR